jgi:hypothetical protein
MPPARTGTTGTNSSTNNGGGGARNIKSISQLATMDLNCTDDLAVWCEAARHLLRTLGMEIQGAAAIIEQRIAGGGRGSGGGFRGGIDRFQFRRAIKNCLKPLYGSAAECHTAAAGVYKFWVNYRRDFDMLLHPERGGWKFEEGKGRK